MPAPTHVYKVVVAQFKVEGTAYVTDLAEVNDLASQGYDVVQMLAIGGRMQPGGFVYLMSRTVTNIAEKTDG